MEGPHSMLSYGSNHRDAEGNEYIRSAIKGRIIRGRFQRSNGQFYYTMGAHPSQPTTRVWDFVNRVWMDVSPIAEYRINCSNEEWVRRQLMRIKYAKEKDKTDDPETWDLCRNNVSAPVGKCMVALLKNPELVNKILDDVGKVATSVTPAQMMTALRMVVTATQEATHQRVKAPRKRKSRKVLH